eukprot:17339-Heterococcus_DN1.PRE.1
MRLMRDASATTTGSSDSSSSRSSSIQSCQLTRRHWTITNNDTNHTDEVDGPAVIGEYPLLKGVQSTTTADGNRSSGNSAAATAIATERVLVIDGITDIERHGSQAKGDTLNHMQSDFNY